MGSALQERAQPTPPGQAKTPVARQSTLPTVGRNHDRAARSAAAAAQRAATRGAVMHTA